MLFKGKKGKQLEKELGQKTKSVIGGMAGLEAVVSSAGRTQEEVDAIKVCGPFCLRLLILFLMR